MQDNQEPAYQEFARTFGPQLRRWFQRHGLTPADAEDVAVSCITDIALKVDRYRPKEGGSFTGWVFALARHALADWGRKRAVTVQFAEGSQQVMPEPSEPDDRWSEPAEAVRAALERLSDRDRSLIHLRYLHETLGYEEIGERLGIKAGTARVGVFRALERLERILLRDARVLSLLKRRVRTSEYEEGGR